MSLMKRIEQQKAPAEPSGAAEQPAEKAKKPGVREERVDKYAELKIRIHHEVIDSMDRDLRKAEGLDDEIRQKVKDLTVASLEREVAFLPYSERQQIAQEIIDEVLGFGPIEPLLNDVEVSEIMVNSPKQVYCERKGKITLSEVVFRDDQHVMHIIDKIVSPIGRRCDESSPMVDARLPDGSRVNAIIPPLALRGPCITIRKFSRDPLKISDLIRYGSMSQNMARFLEAAVKGRMNIVISGGTGSGKTTALNVLSSFIPADERIVTVEDSAELQLNQDHVISLETRSANVEGKGAVTMRDLVKNTLRMRPDRIVVGEVRSGEALDMLQAMNTGHDGSLTTGHANTPRDMLSRLETMVLMSGMELPVRAIREQIASAVNLIVQQSRLRDGSRKMTYITEVVGMEGETIVLQDIFIFDQQGVDERGKVIGEHKPTGIVPKLITKIEEEGIHLPREIFLNK